LCIILKELVLWDELYCFNGIGAFLIYLSRELELPWGSVFIKQSIRGRDGANDYELHTWTLASESWSKIT
jgi:hypothetical protein